MLIVFVYYPLKKYTNYKLNKIKEDYLIFPNDEINIPFTNIETGYDRKNIKLNYPCKNYKIKEIGKYEIGKNILKILDGKPNLKEEFLLDNPEILIDKEIEDKSHVNIPPYKNIYFKINIRNFSYELQELLLKNSIFNSRKNNYIYGTYKLSNQKKTIYQVEMDNKFTRMYTTKEFKNNPPSRFKCPVVASEYGVIFHYLQLKKIKILN